MDQRIAVPSTCLDKQDADRGILGQPTRKHAARRTGTNDDVVPSSRDLHAAPVAQIWTRHTEAPCRQSCQPFATGLSIRLNARMFAFKIPGYGRLRAAGDAASRWRTGRRRAVLSTKEQTTVDIQFEHLVASLRRRHIETGSLPPER